MICIEKNRSHTKLFMWKTGRCIPFFSLFVKYSNARYIMFDKLFALVELSFVDTHTLLWGTGTIMSR